MTEENKEKLIELFKAYSKNGSEEERYRVSELGKGFFKQKISPDQIIGLYIEVTRNLRLEDGGKDLNISKCEDLLLEMMITYSVNFLKSIELREELARVHERELMEKERFNIILKSVKMTEEEIRNPLILIEQAVYIADEDKARAQNMMTVIRENIGKIKIILKQLREEGVVKEYPSSLHIKSDKNISK